MIKHSLIPVLALISIFSQANTYNIKDFGAKGDGKTIDSPAINRAIEAAAQAVSTFPPAPMPVTLFV